MRVQRHRSESMKHLFILLASLCLLTNLALRLYGVEWTSCRGPAGHVGSIFLDPQNPAIVYANANRWIHKSTDNGATWNVISPYDLDFFLWGISPLNSDILYGGMEQSLFVSTDAGSNWRHLKNFGFDIKAFMIDPRTPDMMYIGTQNGIFKSLDGGESWSHINRGLTNFNILVLAMDPRDSSTLFIGTSEGTVFKTADGGASWSEFGEGLSDSSVLAIAVDPLNSKILYISFNYDGLYKSTDGGATWIGISTNARFLAIDPEDPSILYIGTEVSGVAKSTDGGLTWKAQTSGMGNKFIRALLINPWDTQKVYASGDTVYKSTNGGVIWYTSGFMDSHSIKSLAIDPQNPDILYAGTTYYGGIYKSTSGCSGFKPIGLKYAGDIQALAFDPNSSSTVYAAADRIIYKSTDGGAIWGYVGSVPSTIHSLLIDPEQPSIFYAGTYYQGIFKSVDSGVTWTAANNGLTNLSTYTLAMDPTNPKVLYAGVYEGVFKSIDGGEGWIFGGGLTNIAVYGLAIDPKEPNKVYAGGGYRSTDGGLTWISGNGPDSFVSALAVNPQDPAIIYAAAESGFFVSPDSGQTWNYELADHYFRALAISPSTPETAYVGTGISGVLMRSTHPSPVSSLTALDPGKAIAGEAAFALSVYGNRFAKNSQVRWDGFELTTAFISSMNLQAQVPATLLAAPGVAQITVESDGTITNSFEFTILPSVPVTLTIDTTPTGLSYSVDGQLNWAQKSFTWPAGSRHYIFTNGTLDHGSTLYTFAHWSDNGPAGHTIEVPQNSTSYTASFNTLHRLTSSVTPEGSGRIIYSQVGYYFPSGTPVGVSAVANDGYIFAGWSGDLTGETNPQAVIMSEPRTITAVFAPISSVVNITISANPAGRGFLVDGVSYTSAQTFSWTKGTSHNISVGSPQAASSGTRYVFANWSDGGGMNHTITAPVAPATYTANFAMQYLLTTSVSPQDSGSISISPTSADGYYPAGSSVLLTAIAGSGYRFANWSGSVTGTINQKTIYISAPHIVSAAFQLLGTTRPPRLPPEDAGRIHKALTRTVRSTDSRK